MTSRRALLLVLLACALAVGLWWRSQPAPSAPRSPELSVDEVVGEVVIRRDGRVEPAVKGMELVAGDEVATGAEASATLERAGEGPVTLLGNTTVRVTGLDEGVVEIELVRGQVRARVRPNAPAVRIRNRARSVRLQDAAAHVGLSDDDVLAVDALEGRVEVDVAGSPASVAVGERLVAHADGSTSVFTVPAAPLLDVAWPTAGVGPKVRLEGRADPGSLVRVAGGEAVRVDQEGRFVLEAVVPADDRLAVIVVDVFGTERTLVGEVQRDVRKPNFRIDLGKGGR